VDVRENLFHVRKAESLPHKLSVQQARKGKLEELAIVDCKAHHNPDELKFLVHVKLARPEPMKTGRIVVGEHPVGGVEKIPEKELEKLFRHATLVHTLLPDKLNLVEMCKRCGALGIAFIRCERSHKKTGNQTFSGFFRLPADEAPSIC
jgi:hypothetical protein